MEAVKEKTNKQIYEKIRLNRAFINYNSIIEKQLPYKFSYLDEWLLKKSKLLLKEAEEKQNVYRIYKRGTIVKVDFGVALGSEMSQVHFAIVLNNYDNPRNNILTVVPLTSKAGKFNVKLGNLIGNKILNKLEKNTPKLTNYNLKDEELKTIDITNIEKIHTLLSYYKKNFKTTYACCSLITTISKNRILPPINEYDIIGNERCSDEIMNILDKEILDRFTKSLTKMQK